MERALDDLHYAAYPAALRPANRVTRLRGGVEAFPAMLQAIAGARDHVHLETYIYRSDRTGRLFGEALAERARAGVAVRLLYDAIGSLGIGAEFLEGLRRAGVQVIAYRPIAPWRARWGLNRRDHRKLLVVDGRVGFVGGINIGDEYAPEEEGGEGWYDVHARVEGPAVLQLGELFRATWDAAGGGELPPVHAPTVEYVVTDDTAFALALGNEELRRRRVIRRSYLRAIRRARGTVSLMNAYFVPDRGIRRALARAVRRGVSVRVIVPGTSDLRAVQYASQATWAKLLRRGVRLLLWPGRMMHAKFAVVDGVWTTIGSYNLDSRSLFHNLEVVITVIDRPFGARMQAEFEDDAARCHELALGAWTARPWWRRALEWFFYQFRHWL